MWRIALMVAAFFFLKNGNGKEPSGRPRGDSKGGARGLRNNNPGNIKFNAANAWQGKISYENNTDEGKTFEQFVEMKYGTRAMIKLLQKYYRDYRLVTLNQIICRYAPDSCSKASAYIPSVAQFAGIDPNMPFPDDPAIWKKIIQAMAKFENGVPVTVAQLEYDQAYQLV